MKTETTTDVAITSKNDTGLLTVDMNGKLPDLEAAEVLPFDLMADYWTPEKVMESKRVFFDKISPRTVIDDKTGDQIELECAYFIEQTPEGAKTLSNGSKRLVGAIQSHNLERGTPLLIVYQGKKKNATNSFQSDNWSIKPLTFKIS